MVDSAERTGNSKLFAGVDIGSAYSKAVVLNEEGVLSYHVTPSSGNYKAIAEQVLAEALSKVELSSSELSYVVATGIGASSVSFADHRATDISCQG
ncbi:MAG: BadF/BadG/BcrA/BcrD ATPase family protein, partial [Chloroflexota bacterium]|nr:BadF/BadG/BcrA/BcrD ATPase family protein [Chloroflexota bacterium]